MEEQQSNSKKTILGACLSVVASVLLANTGLGNFIFTIPLVLISYSFKETYKAVLVQVASVLITVGIFLFQYRGLYQQANLGFLLFSAYLILAPGLTCILYTGLRDWSQSVLRRIVASSLSVLVLGIAYAVWLSGPNGQVAFSGFVATYNYAISQFAEFVSMFDVADISYVAASVTLFTTVLIGEICSLLPILLAETAFHKVDDAWQSGFAFMKMPNYYAYLFIALVVSSIVSSVAKLPQQICIALWNGTIWLGMHYMLNGMSLYFYWRRKGNPYFLASRVVFTVIIVNFLPGLGFFICFALAMLGLLETWIGFRE